MHHRKKGKRCIEIYNDGSAFCIGFSRLEVPEQTLGGIPLGLGMVMKINFFEFSFTDDEIKKFEIRFQNGFDLRIDERYNAW